MSIVDIMLWPGTAICRMFGVDSEKDMGLIRSMFNMLVYLTVMLVVLWMFM
ncbi:hypothetical protein KUL25_15175 [Rhodobacteraceae bacterium N5(2021)]|uniref:Uncharacterized protein n=1 Tax=Gymnodinialimonas phycosphaerae TaxID=2841589 RepID=A0A975TT64_9RHOB|nr:hypothetical protein [Gymnodinialimonas phycosphaerae]MBY4894100.1 hypothetical protein [Gymnodinialimonas phycosphaerae]